MLVCITWDQAASIPVRASGICEPTNRTLSTENEIGSTYSICGNTCLRVSRTKSGDTPMISDDPIVPGAGFALQRRRFQVTILPIVWEGELKPSLRIAVSLTT